jgi:hypothetical protein
MEIGIRSLPPSPCSLIPNPCSLSLSRRPGHWPATQQMQVQMFHRLAAVLSSVYDDAITFTQAAFLCDIGGHPHEMAKQFALLETCVV